MDDKVTISAFQLFQRYPKPDENPADVKAPTLDNFSQRADGDVRATGFPRHEFVDIYGYSLQVKMAITQWHKFLNDRIENSHTTPQNTVFFSAKGDPNKPDSTYQYHRSFADLIAASTRGGTTSVIHRRSVVVLLVASWEDHYRALIARECGLKEKDDLKSQPWWLDSNNRVSGIPGAVHDEDFHDLVAERYERKATIVTSNLDFTEWGEAFPNKLLGAATLDRLKHGAYRLILDGKSYRKPRPMEEQITNPKI